MGAIISVGRLSPHRIGISYLVSQGIIAVLHGACGSDIGIGEAAEMAGGVLQRDASAQGVGDTAQSSAHIVGEGESIGIGIQDLFEVAGGILSGQVKQVLEMLVGGAPKLVA